MDREVVEALQQGDARAAYGKASIERLARQLTERYGNGPPPTLATFGSSISPTETDRVQSPWSTPRLPS
jgi:hypothetical protein